MFENAAVVNEPNKGKEDKLIECISVFTGWERDNDGFRFWIEMSKKREPMQKHDIAKQYEIHGPAMLEVESWNRKTKK